MLAECIVKRVTSTAGPEQDVGAWCVQASGEGGSAEADGAQREEEEQQWRRWVDERLVRLLTVNIYRSWGESFQTFEYIADTGKFNWAEREAARLVGAVMMWGISGRLRKKYGIEGDVRVQLYEAADAWVDAVGDRRCVCLSWLLGSQQRCSSSCSTCCYTLLPVTFRSGKVQALTDWATC